MLCLQLPNGVAKARSRALTALVDGFGNCYKHFVGSLQRVCIVELAADGRRLVGHTKSYIQVRALCDCCSFDPRSAAGMSRLPAHPLISTLQCSCFHRVEAPYFVL